MRIKRSTIPRPTTVAPPPPLPACPHEVVERKLLCWSLRREEYCPSAFLCSFARMPLSDPVTAADGYTYERVYLQIWLGGNLKKSPKTNEPMLSTQIFENHTLYEIIANCQKYGLSNLGLRCPLTKQPFIDPVICADGYTYERSAISKVINRIAPISPKTGEIINNITLIPNHAIRDLLQQKAAEQVRPEPLGKWAKFKRWSTLHSR